MYAVKVDGMIVKSYCSFKESKRCAKHYNGKVCRYTKAKLPKAVTLSYNDPKYVKREMIREIYSENNHGYHLV